MSSSLIIDPVCGRELPAAGHYVLVSRDQTYSFCSQACLQRFQDDLQEVDKEGQLFHRPYANDDGTGLPGSEKQSSSDVRLEQTNREAGIVSVEPPDWKRKSV